MFQPAKSERSPHEPRQNNGTGRHHCRGRVGRLRAGVPTFSRTRRSRSFSSRPASTLRAPRIFRSRQPLSGPRLFQPNLHLARAQGLPALPRLKLPGGPRDPLRAGARLRRGSAINGVGANRGAPHDYDEWGAMGVEGWSWKECLPYFKKLERDLDIDNELHGKHGPFPIRRTGEEIWTPFTRTMLALCEARGIPFLPDQNGVWEDGVFEMAVNVDEQRRRVSTAWAYLGPEIRRRPNLEIRTDATVSRIFLRRGERTERSL